MVQVPHLEHLLFSLSADGKLLAHIYLQFTFL